MDYRAWLVDLDGTLYRAPWLKLAMGAELLLSGVTQMNVIRVFRDEHERMRAEQSESLASPYDDQLRRAAERLGTDVNEVRTIVQHWMIHRPAKWLQLFRRRALLTEIETFRQQGGRTAVVSDYPTKEKLAALGATQLFDTTVANGEPGGPRRLKPWPDGYLLAAERLAIAPQDCLVLGDRLDADGAAAQKAGMHFRLIR